MGLKKFKISKYVTYHDLPKEGAAATITEASEEMLDNYHTGQKDRLLMLKFKEFKPLVCKNPVLDALDTAFPNIEDPSGLVNKRIWLYRSDERVAGTLHQLVRVNELKTIPLNSPTAVAGEPPQEPGYEESLAEQSAPPIDDTPGF